LEAHDQRLGDAQALSVVEHRAQAATAQVLAHQVGTIGLLTPVEDGHDVGVVQGGGGAGLGPEAPEESLVAGQSRVQHLHGHPPAEPDVVGQIDVAGRTGADRSEQPVPVAEDAAELVSHPGRAHE
jgi:hypothetical protein